MIISIPTKAKNRFIELCQITKDADSETTFIKYHHKADSYSEAIKDILGTSVWYSIVSDADREVGSDDCPTCAGVPIYWKHSEYLKQNKDGKTK